MNYELIFLSPPVAFATLLVVIGLLVLWASRLSGGLPASSGGALKSYACGEDVKEHHARPDYSQFFPFAFFFTIMHVIALIIATVPAGNMRVFGMALLFIVASAMGLFILYRN